MKDAWIMTTIEEACNVEYGTRVVKKRDSGTRYPVYGGGGATFMVDSYNRENRVVVSRFGMSPQCVRRVDGKFFLNDSGLTLSPKDSERLSQRLLDYMALSLNEDIYKLGRGQAQRNLNVTALRQLQISFPKSITEQHRIVETLDRAMSAIEVAKPNADTNQKNAELLFHSFLTQVFSNRKKSWATAAIGDIADHSLGKMLDKRKNKGVPRRYLRNLNVRWFHVDCTDLLTMRFQSQEEERYSVQKGDLLICEGGYPGRAAIWESEESIFFQKAIHRVRFREAWLAKWMMYFLYSEDASGRLKSHFSGAGIQHFTGVALRKFQLPLPPDNIGRSLVSRIEEVRTRTEHISSIFAKKATEIEGLRMSILSNAFAEKP